MLRFVWIAISTLAIANLFALVGFVVWLNASGRLNTERVERMRLLFTTTLDAEKAEAARKADDEAVAAAAAAEAAKVGQAPLTAEQKLDGAAAKEEIDAQNSRRVQRETADLINTLLREREELERQRADFQKQIDAFDAMRKNIAEEEGSEQFQKTVQVYQSVKPKEAKSMMASLMAGGLTDQVVSYLNALSPRIASKIIAEFEKDDPTVAADLLERLRLRGTAVAGPGAAASPPVAAAPPEGP